MKIAKTWIDKITAFFLCYKTKIDIMFSFNYKIRCNNFVQHLTDPKIIEANTKWKQKKKKDSRRSFLFFFVLFVFNIVQQQITSFTSFCVWNLKITWNRRFAKANESLMWLRKDTKNRKGEEKTKYKFFFFFSFMWIETNLIESLSWNNWKWKKKKWHFIQLYIDRKALFILFCSYEINKWMWTTTECEKKNSFQIVWKKTQNSLKWICNVTTIVKCNWFYTKRLIIFFFFKNFKPNTVNEC